MRRAFAVACAAGLMALVSSAGAQSIEAIEREITEMVERVSESIVSISATAEHGGRTVARSVGCGVVFDRDGLVLTTASVVGRATEVDLVTSGGAKYRGQVLGTDPASDIAVVKVVGANLKPAVLAKQRTLRPGSWVFVLGNAFGSLPSVSMGVLSGLTAPVKDDMGREMLRLSVPINPGDTGAPVVNTKGEVVGIAVGRISFSPWAYSGYFDETQAYGFGGLQPSSMSVAVPAERAVATARDIVATGGKVRGFLGVRVVELSDDMRNHLGDPVLQGVVVTQVVASSPAESIGLAPGDVITAFGSQHLDSVSSLLQAVGATKPGSLVTVDFIRDSRRVTQQVRLTPYLSEYLRDNAERSSMNPNDVGARIDYIRAEIERLKANLKELEDRQ
jgi:S1-C subfamily serine protease